jgi:hypothetical protein
MKLKHKILAYSMVPALLGAGFIGINSVSANGFFGPLSSNLTPDQIATRQQTMFQSEAQILGLSLDEVKDAWASGKSFALLAKDKGITPAELQQKMKDARLAQIKTQLKALVDNGVITQSQADKRLATMQAAETKVKGKSGRMGRHGGMGMDWLEL